MENRKGPDEAEDQNVQQLKKQQVFPEQNEDDKLIKEQERISDEAENQDRKDKLDDEWPSVSWP